MVGIIDESTPWLTDDRGDVLYSLALVVLADDVDDEVGVRLRSALNRRQPFHWESDVGPNVRGKLIDELRASASTIVVAAAGCRRRDQTETRRDLLSEMLLPAAFGDGVTRLVIERQSRAENEADVRTVRDWARSNRRSWRPTIDHVDKNEPRPGSPTLRRDSGPTPFSIETEASSLRSSEHAPSARQPGRHEPIRRGRKNASAPHHGPSRLAPSGRRNGAFDFCRDQPGQLRVTIRRCGHGSTLPMVIVTSPNRCRRPRSECCASADDSP